MNSEREVVLITGPGKSGTHFLSRLLDSCTDLSVYPHEFHFLRSVKKYPEPAKLKELVLSNVFADHYIPGYYLIPNNEESNSLKFVTWNMK